MKTATLSRRSLRKTRAHSRKHGSNGGGSAAASWAPPDFKKRLQEDFGGKIMPFSYVDFLER